MLLSLSVKNIALIDSLEIDFSSGLTILSGETGAGKSIIIDSINFVLGDRADKSLIRFGENEAVVDAEFDSDINAHVRELLGQYEIDFADGVIISRRMTVDGRNTCRINGVKVTASTLREVASMLVDIYGQHDTATLLMPKLHMQIIDGYGKNSLKTALDSYAVEYNNYKNICASLKRYGDIKDVNAKLASLKEKIEELNAAKIKLGEEDALAIKLKRYDSVETMKDGIDEASEAIDGEGGACDKLRSAVRLLKDIAKLDDLIGVSMERIESSALELEDVTNSLSRLLSGVDYDEYDYERTETRLDSLRDVLSRYGGSEETALERLTQYNRDFEFYSNSEFEVIELNKKKILAIASLYKAAIALSERRRKVAKDFEVAVLGELQELGMGRTKFEVEFQPMPVEKEFLSSITTSGIDVLEFVISPNPGQPLRPLAKIISGGEMSRFMLAIKKITSDIDGVNVMVFDEIDTGISGNIATVVARKLTDISRNKQVLSITHLPQLASYADTHYYITKKQTADTTSTNLEKLGADGMIKELARLIGGDGENSQHALAHAKEMKDSASQYKSIKK